MTERPGILALWNDCAPEGEAEYERWYMAQHLPERVGNPGFRFGRRYLRLDGDRRYFTFYETESPSVLWSPAYLERLEAPTDWTQRVMPNFRNTIRTVCRKAASLGEFIGGHATTFRVTAARPPGPEVEAAVRGAVLPALQQVQGVCHAHLWVAADRQTPSRTAETHIRGADTMLSWAVVAETTTEEACRQLAQDPGILSVIETLAGPSLSIGCYRLICILGREMLAGNAGA